MKHLSTLLIATFFATMLYTSCESSLFGGDDNEEIKLDFKCQVAGRSPNATLHVWNYSSGADEYVWSFSNGTSVSSRTGYIPDTSIYVRSKGELIVTLTGTRDGETVSDSDTLMVSGYNAFYGFSVFFGLEDSDSGQYHSIDAETLFNSEEINNSNGYLIDFVFDQNGSEFTFRSPDDPNLDFIIPNAKSVKLMHHEGFCDDKGEGDMKDTIKYIDIISNEFWIPINQFKPNNYVLFELPDGRKGFIITQMRFDNYNAYLAYIIFQDLFDIKGQYAK